MSYKSVFDKIREAQKAGTFEGMMKAQGKNIRYFGDDYFATKTAKEISIEMNHEEYVYYKNRVEEVMRREGEEYWKGEQKKIDDWKIFVEETKQKAIDEVMKKVQHLPKPIRPSQERIVQDVKNIVGNPFTGDDGFMTALKDYVGIASTGEIPEVRVGEGKGGENPAKGQ